MSTLADAELEAKLLPDPEDALLDACALADPFPKPDDLADDLADALLPENPLNEFEFAFAIAFEPEEWRRNHLIRTTPNWIASAMDNTLALSPMKAIADNEWTSLGWKSMRWNEVRYLLLLEYVRVKQFLHVNWNWLLVNYKWMLFNKVLNKFVAIAAHIGWDSKRKQQA